MIAELDGAFTDYREADAGKRIPARAAAWVQGSYTRSRYYGNFDQDDSTTADSNDDNIFIGSSNIGDGAGRQFWNNKLGLLRGDRPNAVQALRRLRTALERVGRRLRHRAVGSAVGDAQLPALHRADDQHERHRPIRRTGRLASLRRHCATRPELHAERCRFAAAIQRRGRRRSCSTSSTARPATTSSRTSRRRLRQASDLLRSAAVGVDVQVRVLSRVRPRSSVRHAAYAEHVERCLTAYWGIAFPVR